MNHVHPLHQNRRHYARSWAARARVALPRRSGVVTLLVCILLTLLIGFAMVTLQLRKSSLDRERVQNWLTATVLAAAQELAEEAVTTGQPLNPQDDQLAAQRMGRQTWLANRQLTQGGRSMTEPSGFPRFTFQLRGQSGTQALRELLGPRQHLVQGTCLYPDSAWERRLLGSGEESQLALKAAAQVDHRVVGFRTQAHHNIPIMPLALEVNEWWEAWNRHNAADSGNPAPLLVTFTIGGNQPTATWVSYAPSRQANESLEVIRRGLSASPLSGGALQVGPVAPNSPPVWLATVGNPSTSEWSQLAQLLAESRTSWSAARAYPVLDAADPLHDPTGQGYRILGFVAARVHAVTLDNGQLQFTLQPATLLHPTVWTARWAGEANPFLGQIKLSATWSEPTTL